MNKIYGITDQDLYSPMDEIAEEEGIDIDFDFLPRKDAKYLYGLLKTVAGPKITSLYNEIEDVIFYGEEFLVKAKVKPREIKRLVKERKIEFWKIQIEEFKRKYK